MVNTLEAGLPVQTPGHVGRIQSAYNHAGLIAFFADSPSLLRSGEAEILQRGRNLVGGLTVSFPETDSLEVVIKEFSPRGIDKIKGIILPSKALKAWRGAGALVSRGIGTPEPLLYLEERGLVPRKSHFITLRLRNVEEIRGLFLPESAAPQSSLLDRLAADLRFWHREGILHRDLSDGNILVRWEKETPRFFLIDTNRIRLKNSIGSCRGIKNLIRLGVPDALQKSFLEAYLERRPLPLRYWLWYRLGKTSFASYLRSKKILRIKQITRKLGIQ